MARPIGSRFLPTDLWLVTRCLHDKVEEKKNRFMKTKVEKNKKGFIKTMNVYEDEPWRLDHDLNPLFKRNEWYYFVPRTKRGGNTANRSVPRNGESQGGTWKATTKTNIVDGNKTLVGYKRDFVYNKTVEGKPVKTDWHMSEYSLHKADAEFQDLVLCWIRDLEKQDSKFKFVPREVENNNIVLPNQEEEEEAGFANRIEMMMVEEEEEAGFANQIEMMMVQEEEEEAGFANQIEMMMVQEEEEAGFANQIEMMMVQQGEHGDVNQQRQQQEQDTPILLLPPFQSNENREQYLRDNLGLDGDGEDDTISHDLIMRILDEGNGVVREEDRLQLLQPIPQAQDSGVYADQVMAQDDMMMMMNNSGFIDVNSFDGESMKIV